MAYHFDARGDSSDDEGGATALDLTAWKNGASAKPASSTLFVTNDSSSVQKSDSDQAVEQVAYRAATRSPEAPVSAFRPINQRVYEPSSGKDGHEHTTTQKPSLKRRRYVLGTSRPKINLADYEDYTRGADVVRRVVRQIDRLDGTQAFEVMFEDFQVAKVSRSQLSHLDNGIEALEAAESDLSFFVQSSAPRRSRPSKRQRIMPSERIRRAPQNFGFVSTVDNVDGSDEDRDNDSESAGSETNVRRSLRQRRSRGRDSDVDELIVDDGDGDDEDDDLETLGSDDQSSRKPLTRKLRKKPSRATHSDGDDDEVIIKSTRQSERATRHTGGMREVDIDDIHRPDTDVLKEPSKPKTVTVREVFKPLPRGNDFHLRHNPYCDVCGHGTSMAPLIDCQGCSVVYHKTCLGHRTNREHLVTKIDEDDFVLQCRRCVAYARKKDDTAPDQGKCQECRRHGQSCRPFRARQTPAQEQRDRDELGTDPITSVPVEKLNNPDNVLFRCTHCFRAFHFEHLPSLTDELAMIDVGADAEQRFREYKAEWKCKECLRMPSKVSGIIAWKPIDEDNYDPTLGLEALDEDDKIYLVRWEGKSYFQARWVPGPWVWGVTTSMMRKAFAKRDDSNFPKMRTEDAIPEDYLRTDIVLDIKYTSYVDIRTQEVDKARIREVDKALIKYKGLGYEDAVWETPPSPDDGDRWSDFVVAYNDWVMGHYTRQPRPSNVRTRLEKARKESFQTLEKKTQPANMIGGELMEYQVHGLNWLYYKWHSQENAILADEMGLGKTIQIIGFLATLVQDWDCFPFLIVVPNSTCPNWRREIQRWAPSLRVVAYYGSRESRELAYRYELYPEQSKDLRCHVVVTSYDAAADENCRKFFRGVNWQALIVDEGQRLKNDKNLLYSALGALKAPFKVLLTGTPLQNNARELFNLLQFLDPKHDAAQLEIEYEDLDSEKIQSLHDKIRPFFLRRTKAQVLTFLPPMAQIIVPVSMTFVQKKVYRSILAKDPELMRAIFGSDSNKTNERGSLNNILMQLRKCLCHPFVYNKSIEERNVSIAASHRNLVVACSKLKLLELLLPRLQERGHRVLIFSQFLDMLDIVEDFLDGMQLRYQRLDGNVNALTKQKRIDEFNAEGSALFTFLLSTRAGGVGINLASADTVIILDPDFNPHQDIQALSRAHRIGQKKKVLCFQLVTRASAEERIMQIGRKKLALDHVLIQEMENEEASESDLVSVLRHGAAEIFSDDLGERDIVYDDASINRLLDRSHVENTTTGADKSAETQFSFARVWANDHATLEEQPIVDEEQLAPDPSVWTSIMKERERIAAEEAAARAEEFGRGRRARGNIDYGGVVPEPDGLDITPLKKGNKRQRHGECSDTDFQDEDSAYDDAEEDTGIDNGELKGLHDDNTKSAPARKKDLPKFRRAVVHQPRTNNLANTAPYDAGPDNDEEREELEGGEVHINCRACGTLHQSGSCPLKLAGVEHCNLCGIAHFGHARVCPHIQSETQVRAMLEALKMSNEPEHLVSAAQKYLRGVKGHLVAMKRAQEIRELQARGQAIAAQGYMTNGYAGHDWRAGGTNPV